MIPEILYNLPIQAVATDAIEVPTVNTTLCLSNKS